MLRFSALCFLVVVCCSSLQVEGYGYSLGVCPVVEPQSNFRMDRMLGTWYVIQKTSTASSCIIYNYTRTDSPIVYELEEISQNFALKMTHLKHQVHYTGQLVVLDEDIPAKMMVKFPLNVAGTASYTVFSTDYDTFAAIFTCQKLGFANRYAATILSRNRTLDKIYVDKIRTKLSFYGIDPYDLSIIPQSDCPIGEDNGVNISIDPDTFSLKTITGVARKAWGKIGDGVSYVADGAKSIFRKPTDGDDVVELSANSIVYDKDKNKYRMADPNAEWLP